MTLRINWLWNHSSCKVVLLKLSTCHKQQESWSLQHVSELFGLSMSFFRLWMWMFLFHFSVVSRSYVLAQFSILHETSRNGSLFALLLLLEALAIWWATWLTIKSDNNVLLAENQEKRVLATWKLPKAGGNVWWDVQKRSGGTKDRDWAPSNTCSSHCTTQCKNPQPYTIILCL